MTQAAMPALPDLPLGAPQPRGGSPHNKPDAPPRARIRCLDMEWKAAKAASLSGNASP